MDSCYISIGLMTYNSGLAWTAALIVFCAGIILGFVTGIEKICYSFAICVFSCIYMSVNSYVFWYEN